MNISDWIFDLIRDFFMNSRKLATVIIFIICVTGFTITTKRSFTNENYEISRHVIPWATLFIALMYIIWNVAPKFFS